MKVFEILSFDVNCGLISFEKPHLFFYKQAGQHILSLLTLLKVPIDEVGEKFGKNMHKIIENWKVLGFLSVPVSIRDIFI